MSHWCPLKWESLLLSAGLLSVHESLRLSDAVDELKRGTFSLQARVLEYRSVSAGVEVDLALTASRDQQTVWSSTLTLLSPKNTYRPDAQPDLEITHGKGPYGIEDCRHISGCEEVFYSTCPYAGHFHQTFAGWTEPVSFSRSSFREMHQPGCSLVHRCEEHLGVRWPLPSACVCLAGIYPSHHTTAVDVLQVPGRSGETQG